MKGRPQNLAKTFRQFLHYMGLHARSFLWIGILVAISALANLFGTYMIRPAVNMAAAGNPQQTIWMIVIMGAIYLAGVLSCYGYTQKMARSAQDVIFDIRRDLFDHVQKLPIKVFDSTSHGDLMARFTSDVDTVADALNNSFSMLVQSFIQCIGTLILLFVLNWQLTLIVCVFYVLMFFYIRFASRFSSRFFSRMQQNLGRLNGFAEEMITGLKVVKVFNHEQANMKTFDTLNHELEQAGESALSFSMTMIPAVVSLSYVNYAIVAVVGGFMVLNGQSDVGSLASYLVFVRQAAMPINQFTNTVNLILAALAGAERIFNFMEIEPEVDEGRVTLAYGVEKDGQWTESAEYTGQWVWKHPRPEGVEYVHLRGDIVMDDVCFGYTKKHPILKHISLYANKGQKVAFVGSTGAGKTTITNLINRFYEIQSGTITFDGINIQLIKKDDLRRAMGMVLQDTHLFTGTIMDNIRYGDLTASDEECIEAARLANADSFIRHLPDGYQTRITNDGASLSQGQKQLLAIARAAVAGPAVLILDEATSSIDTRTERLIEKGMDRLMEGRTTFIIAHRLSTVRHSDVIVVLENGQILEKGTHESLLKENGRYAMLYTGQFELD